MSYSSSLSDEEWALLEPLLVKLLPQQGDRQTFKALWKWYRVAGELGHQEAYLKRITEVAAEVADGKKVSGKAEAAMRQDFENHERRVIELIHYPGVSETSVTKPLIEASSDKPGLEVG